MPGVGVRLLLLLIFFAAAARSLRFEIKSGGMKCISEDINTDAMAVGKYSVVSPDDNASHPPPDSHKISVRVTSPYGNSIHVADNVPSGNFAFTATEAGNYLACFFSSEHNPPVYNTIDFEWKTGVAAKDWTNIAKKGKIDLMEFELRKMDDTIKSIHDEMLYLREREEEMQNLNRSTTTNMAILSGISFLVCLSVAGLQLWHLVMEQPTHHEDEHDQEGKDQVEEVSSPISMP